MPSLGKIGSFIGGNAAAAAIFMLASRMLEPVIYGKQGGEASPEQPDEAGGVDPRVLELLAKGRRGQQGTSIIDNLVAGNMLGDQYNASRGMALGSAYRGGARYVSPELETLLQGYHDQLSNIGAGRPRSYSQVMAELGEF